MRRALAAAVLLGALSCPRAVRDDGDWTPPPPRKDEPRAVPADPACPGRALLVKGECRDNGDCLYACGGGGRQRRYGTCECPERQACEVRALGVPPGHGSFCVAGCNARPEELPPGRKPGCAAGEECLPNGRCEPSQCSAGFACLPGSRCAPGEANTDRHGCSLLGCKADGDCPCPAYCVLGRCQEQPGACEHPVG